MKKLTSETMADPGFFLGGGALVSCSTSTPINHIVLQNTSCIRKPQVISGEDAHPLHTPPRSAPEKMVGNFLDKLRKSNLNGTLVQKYLAVSKQQKILGNICFSEQIFYRKQSLGAPVKSQLRQQENKRLLRCVSAKCLSGLYVSEMCLFLFGQMSQGSHSQL